jgi:uncharacterized protein YjbI with pentapeptide repeats
MELAVTLILAVEILCLPKVIIIADLSLLMFAIEPKQKSQKMYLSHFKTAQHFNMTDYFLDIEYDGLTYAKDGVNFKEFERCIFNDCDFSQCTFLAVTFIDCVFNGCNFNATKINYVAFRTATFNRCQMKDINFAMVDKLIFEIAFYDCVLDFSKFYTLKIKETIFQNCSLVAVDFMGADLTGVVFDRCDLYRSEFAKAIANKTNFKTSINYTIDPEKTKLKKAIFAMEGLKGLLFKHDIVVN